jgi:hypothetical protein
VPALVSISIFGLCFTLHPQLAAAPLNDHFTNRIVLAGAYALASGSTFGATVEPGEPNPSFGSGTVWWSWTAPASGQVEIQPDNSSFAPFAVYTGAALNSVILVTNGFYPSFKAVRGTVYQLQAARPSFASG